MSERIQEIPSKDPFAKYHIASLYHFTDLRNLPLIRQLGGLYSLEKLTEMGVKIPNPGGNDWSHEADAAKGMDRFVHLCFKANHPMEFCAREAGRIGASIFLQIHPEVLSWEGTMFSDGVANKSGVGIHSMEDAKKLIDFEVLYRRTNWGDPAIQQRLQHAEKSEILVPNYIPLKFIRNLPNG